MTGGYVNAAAAAVIMDAFHQRCEEIQAEVWAQITIRTAAGEDAYTAALDEAQKGKERVEAAVVATRAALAQLPDETP